MAKQAKLLAMETAAKVTGSERTRAVFAVTFHTAQGFAEEQSKLRVLYARTGR